MQNISFDSPYFETYKIRFHVTWLIVFFATRNCATLFLENFCHSIRPLHLNAAHCTRIWISPPLIHARFMSWVCKKNRCHYWSWVCKKKISLPLLVMSVNSFFFLFKCDTLAMLNSFSCNMYTVFIVSCAFLRFAFPTVKLDIGIANACGFSELQQMCFSVFELVRQILHHFTLNWYSVLLLLDAGCGIFLQIFRMFVYDARIMHFIQFDTGFDDFCYYQ